MPGSGWRDLLGRATWGHPVGRAATFVLTDLAVAAAFHRGGTDFHPVLAVVVAMGGWAVSLVRWPPDAKR
jgi:hypothetical protein